MRSFGKFVFVTLLTAVCVYIVCAFIGNEFDATEWHPVGRFFLSLVSVLSGIIFVVED